MKFFTPGHYPCVGGPMSGRLIVPGFGDSVVFPIAMPSKRFPCGKIRRARYVFANGKCGGDEWTYLKFAGWEKT